MFLCIIMVTVCVAMEAEDTYNVAVRLRHVTLASICTDLHRSLVIFQLALFSLLLLSTLSSTPIKPRNKLLLPDSFFSP